MLKFAVALIAVVAVFFAAAQQQSNPMLTAAQFTDTIFCQPKSLVTEMKVVTGVCRAGKNSSMPYNAQICDPTLRVAGVIFQYSDPSCTVPTGSEVLTTVCSADNTAAVFTKRNNVESLDVVKCNGQEQGKCSGQCSVVLSIQAGGCQKSTDKRTGKVSYFVYNGATLTTTVQLIDWAPTDTQCTGNPIKYNVIADGHCMDGVTMSCSWNSTSAKQAMKPLKLTEYKPNF